MFDITFKLHYWCTVLYTVLGIDIDIKYITVMYYSTILCITGLMVSNSPKGGYYKPAPMVQRPAGRRRRWMPGTQVLREVCNLMRTTNLLIPRTPFLWYVELVRHVSLILVYSTVHMYFLFNRSKTYKLSYFVNVLICI